MSCPTLLSKGLSRMSMNDTCRSCRILLRSNAIDSRSSVRRRDTVEQDCFPVPVLPYWTTRTMILIPLTLLTPRWIFYTVYDKDEPIPCVSRAKDLQYNEFDIEDTIPKGKNRCSVRLGSSCPVSCTAFRLACSRVRGRKRKSTAGESLHRRRPTASSSSRGGGSA